MDKMVIISAYVYMFLFGSIFGWVLELFYRRFFSAVNKGKWMNPGFLNGPYVPLYGFGLCSLFTICYFGELLPMNSIPKYTLVIVVIGIGLTLIELVGGIIFIRHMHLKLWDYSREKFNYKGIICPKFSLYWTILGAVYLFLIHSHILKMVTDLIDNIQYNFIVGMVFGIFIVDFVYTMHFVKSIKQFAQEQEVVIKFEALKFQLKENAQKLRIEANEHIDDIRGKATTQIDELREYTDHIFEPYRFKHNTSVKYSKLGKAFRHFTITNTTNLKETMKNLINQIEED